MSFGCERSCSSPRRVSNFNSNVPQGGIYPHINFERDPLNIFRVRALTLSRSTGGRGGGGGGPRSHIHRAPHDCSCPVLPGGLPWILETVRLPCEFNFCGVCGHIFYDVRAVPFKNWKSLIVRHP